MSTTDVVNGHPRIRLAWERQARETIQAYEAFELYRDLGPKRSIRMVAREIGKSFTLIERWSRVWLWTDRIRRFEDYFDAMKAKALHDSRMRMIERQAKLGERMQEQALFGLDMAEMSEASIGEIASLAEKGVKIERLAFGDSTENRAVSAKVVIQFDGPAPSWAPEEVRQQQKQLEGGDHGDRTP